MADSVMGAVSWLWSVRCEMCSGGVRPYNGSVQWSVLRELYAEGVLEHNKYMKAS